MNSLVETYFDESGSHDNSSVLCLAGYIIERDARMRLDADWAKVLQNFNLPFFRMSACAHGTRPFDALTKDQRIDAEKQFIAITKRYISYGIAITVVPKVYEAVMPLDPEITGSAYSFCAHACLTAVKSWAIETNYTGGIAYFFESGHRSQSEADGIMNRLFQQPQLRANHGYISHTFADKRKVRPLQAADLIAWQWHTDQKRRMAGTALGPRLDCFELMMSGDGSGSRFHALHYEQFMLRKVADTVLRGGYPLTFVG